MQTFLPYADFKTTAACLDWRRLGKQRVEVWQILRTLYGESHGWTNHPAIRMWRGHEFQLAQYGIAICREWILRGYNDTMIRKIREFDSGIWQPLPFWITSEFCLSHQSNLIRKLPEYYGPLFPGVSPDLEYVWPV